MLKGTVLRKYCQSASQHCVLFHFVTVCCLDISQPQAHSVLGIPLCSIAYVTGDQNHVKQTGVHMESLKSQAKFCLQYLSAQRTHPCEAKVSSNLLPLLCLCCVSSEDISGHPFASPNSAAKCAALME